MNQERIDALLHKLDTGWTKPIATPPEFAEAAKVIRYLLEQVSTNDILLEKQGDKIAYLSDKVVELEVEVSFLRTQAALA